ncbi:MAG: hypothetical protein PHW73_08915 [Atribacterota bacterium]|nr:hypothetical protein [Atribacterota bacterium]
MNQPIAKSREKVVVLGCDPDDEIVGHGSFYPEFVDTHPCDLCHVYFPLDEMDLRKVGDKNLILCSVHKKLFDDAVQEVCIPV